MADLRSLTVRLIDEVWKGGREESAYELVSPRYRGNLDEGPAGA